MKSENVPNIVKFFGACFSEVSIRKLNLNAFESYYLNLKNSTLLASDARLFSNTFSKLFFFFIVANTNLNIIFSG